MTRPDEDPPEWAKERAREVMAAGDDDHGADDADGEGSADAVDRVPDIPVKAVDEAERLTRLAREVKAARETETARDAEAIRDAEAAREAEATREAEAAQPTPNIEEAAAFYRKRRDELAAEHGYVPRVREEDDTLVLYPDEWMDGDTVRVDRIEDTDRAVEVSLSGPGDAGRYRAVAAYNDAVAEAVAEREAAVHARTAEAFAAFMSNHYVRRVDEAGPETRAEFREEYLVRNGWPTDEQLAVVEESLSVIESVADDIDESVADDIDQSA